MVASAQLILATALSGWSPNSPATCAAQPRTPSRCSVAATARRIWPGEWDPEGCRVEANSAPARAASNVPGPSYQGSDVFVARISAIVPASLPSHLRLIRYRAAYLSSFAARAAQVFTASVQLDYRPAGISGLRSARADERRRRPVYPGGGQLHYRLAGNLEAQRAVTVDSRGRATYAAFCSSRSSTVAPELNARDRTGR